MTEKAHARFSPSRAHRDLVCVGAAAMEDGLPDTSSEDADLGTAAHQLGSWCLTEGKDTKAYLGRVIEVERMVQFGLTTRRVFRSFTVNDDMAENVQVYVDAVRSRLEEYRLAGAESVELFVEERVPIAHITGEDGAEGTSDAIIVAVWADGTAILDCWDLKYGYREVEVENNEQLQMYALGSLYKLDLLYNFTRVRLNIHQVRKSAAPSEWEISVEELIAFGARAKQIYVGARLAFEHRANWIGKSTTYLTPGDHCRNTFCKARATCPALAKFVTDTVGADFEDLTGAVDTKDAAKQLLQVTASDATALGRKMAATDLIEDWCKAVRAKVEAVLFEHGNSEEIRKQLGQKIVQGKKGNRQWRDETEVEKVLKSMRLKQEEMYDFELISPTTAEKRLKDTPKRWNRLTPLITQKDGAPSVAPESDKRPAMVIGKAEDDFEALA